ncbi:MAG: phytanoyl-CoA dioxygenase family protein [Vulcanimicrobiota bacterium]
MLSLAEREELYRGRLITGTVAQVSLGDEVWARIREEFGVEPRAYRGEDFLTRLNALRQRLCAPEWRERCRAFLTSLGLDPAQFLVDRFRLRGLAPGADTIPAAAAAFYAHRDCWYANPQNQINLWLPLHDVDGSNSFGFYPEFFERPVENDSERFEYHQFVSGGGFQSTVQDLVHPRWLTEPLPDPSYKVELRRGQFLLFSASHLHASLPNRSGCIRFSLDLRLVHLADRAAGLGAPGCDNRSRGDASIDYIW